MDTQQHRRGVIVYTGAAFYCLFLLGFVDNLKGPTIPAMMEELHFNYSQGGTILLAAYFGFVVATLLTGVLADLAGRKSVLIAAGLAILVGVLGFVNLLSFWGITVSMFVVGLGLGALDLGGNAIIIDLRSDEKGRYLNLISFAHGASSIFAPLLAGSLIVGGLGWRLAYQISLILALAMILLAVFVRYPAGAQAAEGGLDFKQLGKQIMMPEMRWFYILLMAYIGAEISMGSWLVAYLQEVRGQSVNLSSIFLSLFFTGLMAGRLLGSFVVEKVGYLRSLLVASLGASLCMALGLFGPPFLVFFFPLTGFFYSVTFSMTTAMVTDMHQENVGSILGLLFAFGGLGGALGPWLIGLVSDEIGIQVGFGLNLLYTLLVLASVLKIKHSMAERVVSEPV